MGSYTFDRLESRTLSRALYFIGDFRRDQYRRDRISDVPYPSVASLPGKLALTSERCVGKGNEGLQTRQGEYVLLALVFAVKSTWGAIGATNSG